MAIQMRRGASADFNPTKMLPGEWAVTTDSDSSKQKVYICFSTGNCKELCTVDDLQEIIGKVGIATTSKAGLVIPDGTTITVDDDGTIHAVGGGTEITVDQTVSNISTNPVANKAITNEIINTIGWTSSLSSKKTIQKQIDELSTSGVEISSMEGNGIWLERDGIYSRNIISDGNTIEGTRTTYGLSFSTVRDEHLNADSENQVKNKAITNTFTSTIGWYQEAVVNNLLNPEYVNSYTFGFNVYTSALDKKLQVMGRPMDGEYAYRDKKTVGYLDDTLFDQDGDYVNKKVTMMPSANVRYYGTDAIYSQQFQLIWEDKISRETHPFLRTMVYEDEITYSNSYYTKGFAASVIGVDKSNLRLKMVFIINVTPSSSGEYERMNELFPLMVTFDEITGYDDYVPYKKDESKKPIQEQINTIREAIPDFSTGQDGQFLVSDGNGGFRWKTVADSSEVSF